MDQDAALSLEAELREISFALSQAIEAVGDADMQAFQHAIERQDAACGRLRTLIGQQRAGDQMSAPAGEEPVVGPREAGLARTIMHRRAVLSLVIEHSVRSLQCFQRALAAGTPYGQISTAMPTRLSCEA